MKKAANSWRITVFIATLVSIFLIWCCYEMHRQNNLEPLAYIGASVIGLLTVIVSRYMWRAKQSDLYQLELKKIEKIAQLKMKYGDNVDLNFDVEQVDDDVPIDV